MERKRREGLDPIHKILVLVQISLRSIQKNCRANHLITAVPPEAHKTVGRRWKSACRSYFKLQKPSKRVRPRRSETKIHSKTVRLVVYHLSESAIITLKGPFEVQSYRSKSVLRCWNHRSTNNQYFAYHTHTNTQHHIHTHIIHYEVVPYSCEFQRPEDEKHLLSTHAEKMSKHTQNPPRQANFVRLQHPCHQHFRTQSSPSQRHTTSHNTERPCAKALIRTAHRAGDTILPLLIRGAPHHAQCEL